MKLLIAAFSLVLMSSTGSVDFLAVGNPGFLKIIGIGGKVEATKIVKKNGKISGEYIVNLADFDTGIALRNEHMRDIYLEVKKYPQAIFKVKELPTEEGEHDFSGELTLHGVTKLVSGKYTVSDKVKAEFKFYLDDFNIKVPNYLGVYIAKDIIVSVELSEK